jgi:Leucine-rich repeat (LRR) protein
MISSSSIEDDEEKNYLKPTRILSDSGNFENEEKNSFLEPKNFYFHNKEENIKNGDIFTISLGEPMICCHLWNRNYSSLPSELYQMNLIEWLNLSNNRLTELSMELCSSLLNLKNLYASYNQINTISMDIRFLHFLNELSLDHNQITSLPKELFSCSNLTQLYLPFNQLYWIPKDILCLTKLKILSVSYNNLITLPNELSVIKSLEQLHIKNNPFLDSFLEKIAFQTPLKTSEVLEYLAQGNLLKKEFKKNQNPIEKDQSESDEVGEWLKQINLGDLEKNFIEKGIETIEDLHSLQEVDLDFMNPDQKGTLLQIIYKNNLNANNNKYNTYLYS